MVDEKSDNLKEKERMNHSTRRSSPVFTSLRFLYLTFLFPSGLARSAPLLEQVVSMKSPGVREVFSAFDVLAIVLLLALYFRLKKYGRKISQKSR